MQLLNSHRDRIKETLQDIASNVQIQSNFCISHPNYKPLELTAEAVTHFQRVSLDLQRKYLNLQLQNFLYGIYYNGSMRAILTPDTEPESRPNLENNTLLGVDLAFYDRLHQSNCGKGYFDPGWQIRRQESDRSLAVTKGELTLHIDRDRHLEAEKAAVVGDTVAIRMPKNLLQNGFYMAVGDAGLDDRDRPNSNSVTVRIYFNLTAEGAIAVMASLTKKLNEIEIPFSFKVLYNPADYKRYDSGVLYFERSYYTSVRQVLQTVYLDNKCHFQPQVPLFTKQIAPGLAVAEEPNQKFTAQESFGTNRCQIVANGLLEAWDRGETSPKQRLDLIVQHFSLLGIDLERPFLNAGSEDVYTPLAKIL
ncbi:MAG: T3SS effector HopA1 family protein [Hydrococcus sp. Prado102]|nr:T3SS effector HopA1 family protein [Hydrococcus sp. Prado102]